MYEIRPESLATFLGSNIKLPRFQRKQTWDPKKNFELCISIFNGFPIGVCILQEERDAGATSYWLLDGRQRRSAIQRMVEDPENVYDWAKKWCGFGLNADVDDVETQLRRKIRDYLEDENADKLDSPNEEVEEGGEQHNIEENAELIAERIELDADVGIDIREEGIEFLIGFVKMVHKKRSGNSGFTKPFDFSGIISNLSFVLPEHGMVTLNSKKLKLFIKQYLQHASSENTNPYDQQVFTSFVLTRHPQDEDGQNQIRIKVAENWEKILERIRAIDKLERILLEAKIGYIVVKDFTPTDSQKIFNIINSKGTKLNAVEILSAKPGWNVRIAHPSDQQIAVTRELYKELNVETDAIVKWDLPATLLARLNKLSTFLNTERGDGPTAFDRRTITGFKIFAGIYQKGIKKEDIEALSGNRSIDWEVDFENTVNGLNRMGEIILEVPFFRYFHSWNRCMMNLLSDAVAMNFVLVLYQDWLRKGKPDGSSPQKKQFQKNAIILFDRMIYEYATRLWRGSSDGRVAQNLQKMQTEPDLFVPIERSRWNEILNEIFDSNKMLGERITQKTVEPLLFHFYALKNIQGPPSPNIEVDHIYPQSLFNAATIPDSEAVRHNLFNLALLPKQENISKGNKRLVEITNSWLRNQIRNYAFIGEDDFERFSNLANLHLLKELRAPIFLRAFGEERDAILQN